MKGSWYTGYAKAERGIRNLHCWRLFSLLRNGGGVVINKCFQAVRSEGSQVNFRKRCEAVEMIPL